MSSRWLFRESIEGAERPWRARTLLRRLTLLIVLALVVGAEPVHAESLPAELEVTIHLKVLSFDTALKDRVTGDTLIVAVVHAANQPVADVLAAFTAIEKKKVTVHHKKVRAVDVPIGTDGVIRLPSSVNALYVSGTTTPDQASAIAKVAHAQTLPTLTSHRDLLQRGLAIAVVAKNKKPSIVVNAGNAKRCGMALDSKLLRLAEVIK